MRPPGEDAEAPTGGGNDAGRAKTHPNVDGRPAPRQPHERDESSDSGTGEPSEVMRRAHDDVTSGKRPTDKGEGTDAAYEKMRSDTPGAERD